MNRREILKAGILLPGVIPAGMVMAKKNDGAVSAKKEEMADIIPGGFTVALVDENDDIASELLPIQIEAKSYGFTNYSQIIFKNFRLNCNLSVCIYLSGKVWFKGTTAIPPIKNYYEGDIIRFKKGSYKLHFDQLSYLEAEKIIND